MWWHYLAYVILCILGRKRGIQLDVFRKVGVCVVSVGSAFEMENDVYGGESFIFLLFADGTTAIKF